MNHKIKNGTVFKEENNDIHINPFWESGNSACFLTVLKGLDPSSIMPCKKPLIKKHSARQPTEMWEREKTNTTQGVFSSCPYSLDDEELKMLHICIRQLHDIFLKKLSDKQW